MNDLQVFQNSEFGQVRTIEENGQVLFCGSDVAKALGYARPRKAIIDHCKGALKRDGVSETTNQHGVTTQQTVEMSFIPEGDVYRLIAHSKLPGADKFEHWVFDEVLPSIRHHGAYMTPDAINAFMQDPQTMLTVCQNWQKDREKLQQAQSQIAEMQPKALFADAVSASYTSILIGDLAKLIRQNGIEIGQIRLFSWMRENGWLMKCGESRNKPSQKGMEMGLFEVKETSIALGDGTVKTTFTPKVTGKGQQYFIKHFLCGLEM